MQRSFPFCLAIMSWTCSLVVFETAAFAQAAPGSPLSATLSLDVIDQAVERRIESEETLAEIDAICEKLRPTFKVDVGRIQSIKTRSLVYCGTAPFASYHEGERTGGLVTYVGLKIHIDHDSKWTPDLEHSAVVLLATRVTLWIEDGKIGYEAKTSIADISTRGDDILGFGNKESKLTEALQKAVGGSIDKRIKDELNARLKDNFAKIPVSSLKISDDGVVAVIGPAKPKDQPSAVEFSAKTTPLVGKHVLLGCKSEDDAVLRVTYYREDMLLHAATRGREGIGPEPIMNRGVQGKPQYGPREGDGVEHRPIEGYWIDGKLILPNQVNYWPHTEGEHREDEETPGRHRITLYLGEEFETRDLDAVPELRLGKGWNDHVGVVVVEAGRKWKRHSLFLTEHPFDREAGGRSWGTTLSLSPGITCFDLDPWFFTNKVTGMSVSKPK